MGAATSTLDAAYVAQDGRIARGLRTREAILCAYEDLIQEAEVPPTGAELAARAGVSARSIFTHFGDMDGVLAATARRALEWLARTHVAIPSDLPLDERLDRFLERRVETLELTAPLYRMLRAFRHGGRQEKSSPDVAEILELLDLIRRRYLASVFSWEIGSTSEASEDELIEALIVATSWSTWEGLRREQALEPVAARRIMRHILRSLLS